jgi:hypothetical protein
MVEIFIICLILTIIVIVYITRKDDYISGFWIISDQFKEESGLENFIIYISPELNKGYIILKANDKILYNDNVNLKISKSYIQIEEEIPNIPNKLVFDIDKNKGKLTIKENSILYGVFYKDNQMSELTVIENN